MRSSYLIPCLVLILMNVHSGFSRMKSRNNKPPVNKKPGWNVPKPNPGLKPGLLLFRGNRLSLYFNMTEESQVYAANYSMFPDGLYYPQPSTANDYKEFVSSCLNTTMDLEANKDKISRLRSDIYTKMTLSVVGFLCAENFYSGNNSADLCPGGLWVVTTASAIFLVMKTIG